MSRMEDRAWAAWRRREAKERAKFAREHPAFNKIMVGALETVNEIIERDAKLWIRTNT